MSKTLEGNLATHLLLETTTLATCWKITRKDGSVKGFTEHEADLTVAGDTYIAATGFAPSAIRSTANMAVDNLDASGFLDSTGLSEDDLLAGLYDYATVEILLANWEDTADYAVLIKGFLGEVRYKRDLFVAEVRGVVQALQQPIGEITSPMCRAILGDDRCKVRTSPTVWSAGASVTVRSSYDAGIGSVIAPTVQTSPPRHFKGSVAGTTDVAEPSWNLTVGGSTVDGSATWETIAALSAVATVTAVSSRTSFTVDSGMDQNDWFTRGTATFSSGSNSGYGKEVLAYTLVTGGEETVELVEALPYDIVVGDTLVLVAGCDLLKATCQTKFDNIYNRRAEDFQPGESQVSAFGGQS